MEELLRSAREAAEDRTWSQAVELARTAEFHEQQSLDPEERVFRVVRGPRDQVLTVSLSESNVSWQCDCSESEDPCRHILATIIAERQGKAQRGWLRSRGGASGTLVHSFRRSGRFLTFERAFVWDGEREAFDISLSSALQRLTKDRGSVAVTKEELQIDHILPSKKSGIFDPKTLRLLLKALSRFPHVEFEGVLTRVSPNPIDATVEVVDESKGFRLRRRPVDGCSESFDNGAAIVEGAIAAVDDVALSSEELKFLEGEGTWYPKARAMELSSLIIPSLEKSVPVHVLSDLLPRARRLAPRVIIETIGDGSGDQLTVLPRLVYGDPVIAEVRGDVLESLSSLEVPIRDRIAEARVSREVQGALMLRPFEAKAFSGEAAVRFVEKLKGWETRGEGATAFVPARDLAPRVSGSRDGVEIRFVTAEGREAEQEAILSAWRGGSSFVRLVDGGWGLLPRAWLDDHRVALERLLSARTSPQKATAALLPDVEEICDALSIDVPEYFSRLRQGLNNPSALGDPILPSDLTAALRSYQRDGVSWLSFLRENGMGALLADDMGLGKTLQAITVMQGRTLVICPTSVLYGWEHQLTQFRPSLSVSRYHGTSRELIPEADVTLTTYALLRLDIEKLSAIDWDTIILDESQTIKNPESQVARAAYKLRGSFKINLSGTPVENSLADLWSQFHFLNPGLLGSRASFAESVERAVEAGDVVAASRLKKKIAPFILRRMKKDVAKELPPKTEVVLECELSYEERVVYDSILTACQRDVVDKLANGGDVFSILELLLRLRQSCCHLNLIPGQSAQTSSKLALLLESLSASIDQGHRALVFSQWTSLLDLVEPKLTDAEISFSRIDGGTSDRERVVREFQADGGPSVLLLSLKAGGVGLNLTAADHVYILDPWWNPAVEDQAADRAYRIGQENPVLVHRLVARETVEERVLELQERKRGLLQAALGEGAGLALSREEILALVS